MMALGPFGCCMAGILALHSMMHGTSELMESGAAGAGACLQVLVQAPCVLGKVARVHARGALRRQLLGCAVGARRPEGAVCLEAALLQR